MCQLYIFVCLVGLTDPLTLLLKCNPRPGGVIPAWMDTRYSTSNTVSMIPESELQLALKNNNLKPLLTSL